MTRGIGTVTDIPDQPYDLYSSVIIIEVRQLNHRFRQIFAFGLVSRGTKRTKIDFGYRASSQKLTSGYATWFTAGGAIRIAHYDVIDDVITRQL